MLTISKHMAYSKLHSSLVYSSLWTQPDEVRLLFITLLAVADRQGYVYGSRSGLERLANIIVRERDDESPWDVLMSPDPDSSDLMRNPENEGRRIEEVPGGFRLLNFEYYRGLRNEDDRREQTRQAQARFREKKKHSSGGRSVSPSKPASSMMSQSNASPSVSASGKKEEGTREKEEFEKFWAAYPRKQAKQGALKAWKKVDVEASEILAALEWQKKSHDWTKEGGKFIPHASTYLNQRRWEDEPQKPGRDPNEPMYGRDFI